jgi:hypothetical protein
MSGQLVQAHNLLSAISNHFLRHFARKAALFKKKTKFFAWTVFFGRSLKKKSIILGASVKFYQHMQKDKAKQWPKVPGGILEILQVLYIVYS